MTPKRAGSLFGGIGATDLALHAAGHSTAWVSETDPYCQRVLTARFPDADLYGDVASLDGTEEPVDILAGGFPCQDLSVAGKGAGIRGPRSGLWAEYARLIRLHRPELVLIENVAAITRRGLEAVLVDLWQAGYDCEWDCIPAMAIGAPHVRDRFWCLAYPADRKRDEPRVFGPVASWLYYAVLKYPPSKWPRAGMVRDGHVHQLYPTAPVPDVRAAFDAGRFLLWPTPTAQDGENNGGPAQHRRNSLPLNAAVKAFPTPTAAPWSQGGGGGPLQDHVNHGRDEEGQAFPTPTERDSVGSRRSTARRPHWTSHPGTTLTDAALTFPTPVAKPAEVDEDDIVDKTGETPEGWNERWYSSRSGRIVQKSLENVVRRWPTPRESDADRGGRGDLIAHAKGRANSHHAAAEAVPTPTDSDGKGGGRDPETWERAKRDSGGGCANLRDHVKSFPTPRAQDAKHGDPTDYELDRDPTKDLLHVRLERDRQEAEAGVDPLFDEDGEPRAWPTPRASDQDTGGGEYQTYGRTPSQEAGTHGLYLQAEACEAERAEGRQPGQLNPDWVEWLMGLPVGWTDPTSDPGPIFPWPLEPAGLPRVIVGGDARATRLSALGNSLVWIIPALLLIAYYDDEENTHEEQKGASLRTAV